MVLERIRNCCYVKVNSTETMPPQRKDLVSEYVGVPSAQGEYETGVSIKFSEKPHVRSVVGDY